MSDDLVNRLLDLHRQATVERSHYYVGKCVMDAKDRIKELEGQVKEMALQAISDNGQAIDAYEGQRLAEAKLEEMKSKVGAMDDVILCRSELFVSDCDLLDNLRQRIREILKEQTDE